MQTGPDLYQIDYLTSHTPVGDVITVEVLTKDIDFFTDDIPECTSD